MADTSGIPDVVRREINGKGSGAPSAQVSRWIRPNSFRGSTPIANSLTLSLPTVVGRRASSSRPNGATRPGLASVPPFELFEIEVLRKPSSSRVDHPSNNGHSRIAPHVERTGPPRSSGPRPSSPARTVQSFCEWCRQPLGPRNHSGRKRVYCSQSCRQRAYQSRKRSKQLGLREGELVVSSVLVARMNRRLKALETALAEVENAELHMTDERIAELCQAARRLRRLVVGPPTR